MGDELPLAQVLSNIIFKTGENPSWYPTTSNLLVHSMRFVENDLLRTEVEQESNCCPPDNEPLLTDCLNNEDAQCIPIKISKDDSVFANKGVDCHSLQQTIIGKDIFYFQDNKMNPVNFNTGWLDLDNVIGSDVLRQSCNSFLKFSIDG